MASAVTSKGQVTIPKPIRDRLGIHAGSLVEFELAADGRVVLIATGVAEPVGRFESLLGQADGGLSTDQIMAMTRGED